MCVALLLNSVRSGFYRVCTYAATVAIRQVVWPSAAHALSSDIAVHVVDMCMLLQHTDHLDLAPVHLLASRLYTMLIRANTA